MRKRTPRRLSHHHQSRSGNPISAPNHFLLRQTKAQDRALLFATTTVLPGHLERFWLDVIELFVIALLSFIHARIWTLFVIESSTWTCIGIGRGTMAETVSYSP